MKQPSERRHVAQVIVVGAFARIILAATIGLGVDESYAVAVARPASLSYYDHPPLAFWITALIERAGGVASDVLLRLPFILLFCLTSWLLYRLASLLFGERAGLFTVVLVTIIPVFGLSDGGWILPDGPLILGFVAAALSLAHIASTDDDREARRWWAGVAAAAALSALSKYHAVFLVAGALVFFATQPQQRRWLARPEPYIATLVAIAAAVPALLWNAQHGWASLRFQTGRANLGHGIHLTSLLQNLGQQAGYVLPWVWVPLAWLFIKSARAGPRDQARWLLVCLGGGPVLVFTLASLGGRPGLPHWPAPGWLLLLPLLGDTLATRETRAKPRAARVYLAGTTLFVVLALTVAVTQIRTGWFSQAFPALFTRGDPSLDAVDWSAVAPAIFSDVPSSGPPIVVAANWIDASKLGRALATRATVLCFNDDARHFRFVADQRTLTGRDAVIVIRADRRSAASMQHIGRYFRSVDSVTTVTIDRGGAPVISLLVYRGRSLLRPYQAPADGDSVVIERRDD